MLDRDHSRLSNDPVVVRPAEPAEMTRQEAEVDDAAIEANDADTRQRLLRLCERKGYKALGFTTMEDYAEERFNKSRDWVIREIKAAKIEDFVAHVQQNGSLRIPHRALPFFPAHIMDDPETIQAIVEMAVKFADGKKPAVFHYEQAAQFVLDDDEEVEPEDEEEPELEPDTGYPQRNGHYIDGDIESFDEDEDDEDQRRDDEEQEARQLEKSGVHVESAQTKEGLAGERRSDEEWLNTLPLRAKLSDRCRKLFDEDALKYRDFVEHEGYRSFVAYANKRLKNRNPQERGHEHLATTRYIKRKHPSQWLLCLDCQGTGLNSSKLICTTCGGGIGYVNR